MNRTMRRDDGINTNLLNGPLNCGGSLREFAAGPNILGDKNPSQPIYGTCHTAVARAALLCNTSKLGALAVFTTTKQE